MARGNTPLLLCLKEDVYNSKLLFALSFIDIHYPIAATTSLQFVSYLLNTVKISNTVFQV